MKKKQNSIENGFPCLRPVAGGGIGSGAGLRTFAQEGLPSVSSESFSSSPTGTQGSMLRGFTVPAGGAGILAILALGFLFNREKANIVE